MLSCFANSISNLIKDLYNVPFYAYDYSSCFSFTHKYDLPPPKDSPTHEDTLVQEEIIKTSFKTFSLEGEILMNDVDLSPKKSPSQGYPRGKGWDHKFLL